MKKLTAFLLIVPLMAGCVGENLEMQLVHQKPGTFYFTASIAEQDFFGNGQTAVTRSSADDAQRVMAGFYDLPVDGRDDMILSVSTLDGMFGKPSPIPEEGCSNVTTRGSLLYELKQEPMYIMETGTRSNGSPVYGDSYTATTEDGTTWGGGFIPHHSDMVSSIIHAVYPARQEVRFNKDNQTVEYATPATSSEQSDLLFAQQEISLGHSDADSLHLTFDHMLTAVRFKIGSRQLPISMIKGITISGIATRGTFDLKSHQWTLEPGTGQSVTCDLDFNAVGAENIIINSGENTFMLLPQKLAPEAKVTIRYENLTVGEEDGLLLSDKGEITATLATKNTPAWEPGQCITYTLTDKDAKSEYILEVEAPEDFSPEGGTHAVNVLSYRHAEGVRTPMRWIVQSYSSDGGKTWMSGGSSNVPKGMSISPTEGTSAEKTPVNVTLMAAEKRIGPHRDFLRYKTPLGYDGEAFDLSTHNYLNEPCKCSTANCYVVDAPGLYRFPTAYGNAITDGKTNSAAYNSGIKSAADPGLQGFPDYNGNSIKAPMIKNNGINLSRATLVWEDVPKLIDPESIKLVDGGNAVEFEILADNIDQGNAVIAVMDGGNIVWSWHIWVTDEKASLAQPIKNKNKNGEISNFMPLTLGWCSTTQASGNIGREAAVRITMPGHLTSQACFRIRQTSSLPKDQGNNLEGNAPYYNWGRKDPFPGAQSTASQEIDGNTGSCMPKDFFQAGPDAATLGLHSEMHVEYDNNYLKLLAAGALNAFNGFLTGVMIGSIANKIIAPPIDRPLAANLLDEHIFEFTESPTLERYLQNSYLGILAETRGIDFIRVGTSYGAAVPWVNGFGESVLAVPMYYEGQLYGYVTFQLARMHAYIYFYYAAQITSRSLISIGPYSAILVGDAALQIYGGSNTFFDILENANFWKGGTEWCKEMTNHGVPVSEGIRHPNILYRDPVSWSGKYSYLWNAGQSGADDPDAKVVKTVYDPSPAGYCVPAARAFNGLTDSNTSYCTSGSTKVLEEDNKGNLFFPGLGMRCFWSGVKPGEAAVNNINDLIMFVGDQGLYWTASPAINTKNSQEVGAYAVNFRSDATYDNYGSEVRLSPRVINNLKLQQSYALPVRPVCEN